MCVGAPQGYYYFIFGFAFLVGILTIIITIEVSIVCTYVQLCAEDYLWWWVPPPTAPHVTSPTALAPLPCPVDPCRKHVISPPVRTPEK